MPVPGARYTDPALPTEQRVEDLLGHMTLEEKVGQLCQVDARKRGEGWDERRGAPGSYLFAQGPETLRLQEQAGESRLGIPVLFGMDCIHGHAYHPGATVFPTQLALSCSWDPETVRRVGRITAREAAYTGVHWTFSPVCGTIRDLRWGRCDETFGEDPHLIGVLASALVRGYQGESLGDEETILACAKHYAGYSETRGGRDASEADLTRRKLLSLFLVPFRMVCEAGCATYMTAYQSIDGVPCTANGWLLTEVLREQWGFRGLVVTDYDNVGRMLNEQFVHDDMAEAAAVALEAGNDMIMQTPDFYEAALEAVRRGRLQEEVVDEACRRVLRAKFDLRLFDERRYPDLERAEEVLGCDEHRRHARLAAERSLVLLKNEDDLLPLAQDLRRVAVIGPNADDPDAQLGDWSLGCSANQRGNHPREAVVTVLDGIRNRVPDDCELLHVRGCDVRDPEDRDLEAAVDAARGADVAVVVLGDDKSLNGELRDRATLDLTGAQQQLLEAVHATGTPVVLVLICGKPLTIPWAARHVPAILCAWNPGMEGGNAVAGALWGDVNPGGKLTAGWPRHVGQQPVYYNEVPGWHTDRYADMDAEPLWPFGHGLSYTSFACSNLQISTEELHPAEVLEVSVEVQNTGSRAGAEVVQLYVNDTVSSVTTPVKELKDFARVELEPGESRTVRLQVPCERLALVTPDLRRVVEPGEFRVMVGPSSRDQDLLEASFSVPASDDGG